jgi:ABC-2 type transport system ATP-binding protein
LFGRGLHVVTEHAGQLMPTLAAALAAAGLASGRMERIVPSLEDVFVSLIEARDRQAAPLSEVAR